MAFGDLIDRAIAPIAPKWAAERVAARAQFTANCVMADAVRKIDAGATDRRTEGWERRPTSADGENHRYRRVVAAAAYDLVSNNKYASNGIRQLVAGCWGDGIQPLIEHPVKLVRERAQSGWDRWAEGKVDGQGDWYGHGKIACREMFIGGDALTAWKAGEAGPDQFVVGMDAHHLDDSKSVRLTNGKIVQGVEFGGDNLRTAYWLFDDHPHDPIGGHGRLMSRRVNARDIDHLYERLRFGQTRGLSVLGPLALTLRDVGDIEDATRLREKLQACFGVIITPSEGQGSSPLAVGEKVDGGRPTGSPLGEVVRPGMVARTAPGETITVLTPTPSSSTVDHVRQQVAAVSAGIAPYHLMTGDVSKANYTALRAAMNGWYSMIGDWQQNEIIPHLARPAINRRLAALSRQYGDPRYLDCAVTYALPRRHVVDPIKDLMGEIMELRAGLKDMGRAMSERGLRPESHVATLQRMNKMLDDAELVLDIDPRQMTQAGIAQKLAEMAGDQSKLLNSEG